MIKFNKATLLNLNPYNDSNAHGKVSKNSNRSIVKNDLTQKSDKKLDTYRYDSNNSKYVTETSSASSAHNLNNHYTININNNNNNRNGNKNNIYSSSSSTVSSEESNHGKFHSNISRNSSNIINTLQSRNGNDTIINDNQIKRVQFEEDIKPLRFKMNIRNGSVANDVNDNIAKTNENYESIDIVKSKLAKFKIDSQSNLKPLTEESSNDSYHSNTLLSSPALNIGLIDKNQFINYLEQPEYIKVNKRKSKLGLFDRLFLAQELNTDINNELSNIGNNSHGTIDNTTDHYNNENFTNIPKHEGNINNIPHNNNNLKLKRSISSSNSSNDIIRNRKAVWKLQFNRNGKYMASANKDGSIRIWKVLSSPIERWEVDTMEEQYNSFKLKKKLRNNKDEIINNNNTDLNSDSDNEKLNLYAPVFNPKPVQIYIEHSENILDIDWSKNDFLITGSMDKLVKIWHIDKKQSLKTFVHPDFVTGVKFHPLDDRFFISSCLDHRVRLWSIIDNEISYEFDCKDLITCLTVSADGEFTIIGTFNGFIYILSTKGLTPITSFHVIDKGTQGRHAKPVISPSYLKGKLYKSPRVTGLECVSSLNNDNNNKDIKEDNSSKLIVTTADSRIRIFDLQTTNMLSILKGFQSGSSPHQANLINWHGSSVIISSSEDHWIYGWELNDSSRRNSTPNNVFDGDMIDRSENKKQNEKKNVISKITRILNSKNNDVKSKSVMNEKDHNTQNKGNIVKKNSKSIYFHAHHYPVTNALLAPINTTKTLSLSNDFICELFLQFSKDIPSLRSSIFDPCDTIGPILVTSDTQGLIRIFRVDMPKEIRQSLINELKHNSSNFKHNSNDKIGSRNSLSINRGKSKSKFRSSFDNILYPDRTNHKMPQNSKYRRKSHANGDNKDLINGESITFSEGGHLENKNKRTSFSLANAIFNKPNRSENSSINGSSKNLINEKSANLKNHDSNDSDHNGHDNLRGKNNSRSSTNTSIMTMKCDVCNSNKFESITSNHSSDMRPTYACVDCGTILNNLR